MIIHRKYKVVMHYDIMTREREREREREGRGEMRESEREVKKDSLDCVASTSSSLITDSI